MTIGIMFGGLLPTVTGTPIFFIRGSMAIARYVDGALESTILSYRNSGPYIFFLRQCMSPYCS